MFQNSLDRFKIKRFLQGVILASVVTSLFIYLPCFAQGDPVSALIIFCIFAFLSLPWNIIVFFVLPFLFPSIYEYFSIPCLSEEGWMVAARLFWIPIAIGTFINVIIAISLYFNVSKDEFKNNKH